MLKNLLDTSVIASWWESLCRGYYRTEQRIGGICRNSRAYRLNRGFWQKMIVWFRFSFLGRITEIREEGNTAILDNSRAVQYLIGCYKRCGDKVISALNTSKAASLTKETKQEFYLSPLKIAGIIAVVAIAANAVLSIILQKGISPWGWSMRGLLLFAGIGGLFCDADWLTVKSSSIVFNRYSAKVFDRNTFERFKEKALKKEEGDVTFGVKDAENFLGKQAKKVNEKD